MLRRCFLTLALLAAIAAPVAAQAAESHYTLTLKDRKFAPVELQVPANTRFTLTVKNRDTVPAEFESNDLNREKVVVGGGTIKVYLGPLSPGRYVFFNDFNPTARGAIVAK